MTRVFKPLLNGDKFRSILRVNKVRKIALFGSHAVGRPRANSDIDFLVDFEKGADLFDQIGLKDDLQLLFKKKVDVVTRTSLNKYIRSRVLKEAVDL